MTVSLTLVVLRKLNGSHHEQKNLDLFAFFMFLDMRNKENSSLIILKTPSCDIFHVIYCLLISFLFPKRPPSSL